MQHLSRLLAIGLLAFSLSAPSAVAEDLDFKSMTLDQLEAVDTVSLDKADTKAHQKALKKAMKAARKATRKANPQKAYCSRSAKSRGMCY